VTAALSATRQDSDASKKTGENVDYDDTYSGKYDTDRHHHHQRQQQQLPQQHVPTPTHPHDSWNPH
jgi:hypothetical protein